MHFGHTTLSERWNRKMTLAKKEEERKCLARRNKLLTSKVSDMKEQVQGAETLLSTDLTPAKYYKVIGTVTLTEMCLKRKEISKIKTSCKFLTSKNDETIQKKNSNEILQSLSSEVKNLKERSTIKDQQIAAIETKINKLEQKF